VLHFKLNCNIGTVSMAEICINNKHFNIEHLYKIADVLEVDVCDLLKIKS
jgi:hypothetical protein